MRWVIFILLFGCTRNHCYDADGKFTTILTPTENDDFLGDVVITTKKSEMHVRCVER